MPAAYDQIPVRMQLTVISNPPVAPIDANTGESVKFWRAQDVAVDLGVFRAPSNACVDLSNIAALQLVITEAPTSLVQLVAVSVGVNDIIPTISWADWNDGNAQQATFVLTAAEMDLNLNGLESRQFWLAIKAVTLTGGVLIYGGGYITIYNPGPNLPIPMPGIVSFNAQVNTEGNFTVTPTSLLHKEQITVDGVARTSKCIVAVSGLSSGCVVELIFLFDDPSVAGIIIEVRNATVGGALLTTVQTDGFQTSANFRCTYNGSALEALSLTYPAFPA